MTSISRRTRVGIFLLLAPMSHPAAAQDKPTLAPADYAQWESLSRATLSPDGRWIAYGIERINEEAELRIRPLGRDTTRSVPWGSHPEFSPTSRWLAWTIGVSPEERKRLERAKEPIRLDAGLLHLDSGMERRFGDVSRYSFDATGQFLVLHGYPPKEPENKGADLRVLHLAAGTETSFGNVADFAWSDTGTLLGLVLATGADAGNGVQVYDARSGLLQSLDVSASTYRQLAWRDDAADLAVLRTVDSASADGTAHRLLAWQSLDGDRRRLELAVPVPGVADTLEIVHHMRPEWSEEGARIAFGLRPVTPQEEGAKADSVEGDSTAAAPNTEDDDEELAGVEIWHTSDVRVVPQQQAAEDRTDRRTLLAIWDVDDNRVVQIGTDLLGNAELLEGWNRAIESLSAPYPWGTMFGRPYRDVWSVNLETGERVKTLQRARYSWESADGRFLLSFDGRDYWTHDLQSGARTNITRDLPTAFADTAYDTPTDLLPPHGVGGWLANDTAVLLYDEYDVWHVAPDGTSAERITEGAAEEIIHRIVRLDTERPSIDPEAPLYFSLHGAWSEKRGYARRRPGSAVERLVFEDKLLSQLMKADSANVFIYRAEAFDDSPDFFATGDDLSPATQLTATNPLQADYAWGRAHLVEYESEAGRRLQGALLYPANHRSGRRYPMIVYTYEILSPRIHRYEVPSERDYYNFTTWTQRGYFVLLPDIVYRWRDPGVSALESVRPAVRKVVDMGLVDADRVGLIGHSWGGYQATFLPTRTHIFAASVAGAPLTDFVSFMGALHWNPGIPELSHWETGQARMEVPYWEDPEAHHRNSPIHKVHELETPLLMAFGNDDGVVDWDQGTEFYNFARRAGKQMVLLVYDGEDHGFRKKPNQIDYHRRILEWFGHYLKGEPAPAWITKGIPVDGLEDEVRRVAAQAGKD